jgi:hypothetical protein
MVEIRVAAEQKIAGDAAHQQQLFQRDGQGVARSVRHAASGVVVGFGARLARLAIGVDPVEDRIGQGIGHVRQSQEGLAPGARLADFPLQHAGQVQLGRFILQAEADSREPVGLHARRNDAEPTAAAGTGIFEHQDVVEGVGIVDRAAGGLLIFGRLGQEGLDGRDARGQYGADLQFRAMRADGLVFARHEGHETEPGQAEDRHHDRHQQEHHGAARAPRPVPCMAGV